MTTARSRTLFALEQLPPTTIMHRPVLHPTTSVVVVFEEIGEILTIDEDHPSFEGSHLLGYEGESGRYCYFRQASPVEMAKRIAAQKLRSGKKALASCVWEALDKVTATSSDDELAEIAGEIESTAELKGLTMTHEAMDVLKKYKSSF